MTLRTRIAAVAGVAVGLTVVAAAFIVYFAVRSNLRGEVEDLLVARVEPLQGAVGFGGAPPRLHPGDHGPRGGPGPGGRIGGPPGGRFGRAPDAERFGGAGGFLQLISPQGEVERPPDQRSTLPVEPWALEIAERDLPHVFERFYRAKGARGMPGSGLGLAIVRQTTEAHGGRVEALNAADGGAILRVSFGDAGAAGPDGRPCGDRRLSRSHSNPVLVTSPAIGPRVPSSSHRLTWVAWVRETR